MLSYWERDAFLEADHLVIGGGIIGLQVAIELKERRPAARVLVLERGLFPSGASTKNAGFACFGSLTEILSDIARMGETAALDVVARRWEGLQMLRSRVGDEAMNYEAFGGFELLFEEHLPALDQMDRVNEWLRPHFGVTVFHLDETGRRAAGFGSKTRALVRNALEGQVHSGRLMLALQKIAGAKGVEMLTGSHVTHLEESGKAAKVHVQQGSDVITFQAGQVAVCTNGITSELMPGLGIQPGRGQVMVTEPIADLPWKGTYHVEEGYFYFRNIGNRILLGGGRNLDFEGEACTEMAITDPIQHALETLLNQVIVPGLSPKIEHRWAGVMGFSEDKQPKVQRISEHMVLGFGCNGMGVALGAEIARRTAAMMAEF